jgi:hypothetical protein
MCLQVIGANVTPKIPSELSSSLLPMDDPRCWHCVATLVRERCWNAVSAQCVGIALRHWSESGVGMLCQRRVRRDVISEGSPLAWIIKRKEKRLGMQRGCVPSMLIVLAVMSKHWSSTCNRLCTSKERVSLPIWRKTCKCFGWSSQLVWIDVCGCIHAVCTLLWDHNCLCAQRYKKAVSCVSVYSGRYECILYSCCCRCMLVLVSVISTREVFVGWAV